MWENCINSEVVFWFLMVADVVLSVFMIYAFVLYRKDQKEHYRMLQDRIEYIKYLETLKK
ncbi:hypothetical protein D3C86_1042310 [compost metagenome]